MKYLKSFNESLSFYDKSWEDSLPEMMTVVKDGKTYQFKKGNIMLNADMIQITYDNNLYGEPNTLEFDVYYAFNDNDNKLKLDIDITYGDLTASEFSIEPPNKIEVVEYTSYHSKFDPSNTVFALDTASLTGLVNYLNNFGHGIRVTNSDFKFLDTQDNYNPN